ncbi:MAG TPA: hypothetical protein VFN10_00840 [Thermoanaerobaculia bacterium]|nr:hypothetical protein [Thermoanaerobaculia bacterium]
MNRAWACAIALLFLVLAAPLRAQFLPTSLTPVGYHPSNVAYFNTPYFSNALFAGSEWRSFTGSEFGELIDFNTAQFVNGYPQFLNPGQKLRATLFGLNIQDPFRPAAWPARDTLSKGRIVVTWNGTADIRLVNGTLVAADSPSGSTGSFTNGRRVYLCTGANQSTQTLEVHAIGATPPSQIRVWLAPADDPNTVAHENETGTLENQLFHPLLLQRLADRNWAYIRFMDWGMTNASPVMDWSDRRLPGHIFQAGIINSRSPALDDNVAQGDRETGVAFEYMVALCNASNKNMWINVPHLATADFMTRLAKLIRFGSDGVNPYDSVQANPVFAPLNSNLKVFIEYSNEIWSSGFSFPQGNWAEIEAQNAGLGSGLEGKGRFNGRKFCDTWRAFQDVFGGTTRLVRVAATFTANDTYTSAFLNEIADYGPTLTPAVAPDVLAVTTYFGNGIQDYVNEQGFATGKLFDDPYWTSPQFATDLTKAFDEWKRRMMAGDAVQGAGPDATGIGGGFSASLHDMTEDIFGTALPILAYEGGPSLFTDSIDGNAQNGSGVPTDDGVTTFIEAMNRDARIAGIYRIHLDIARSKGLWTHTPYTDTSPWSRFGQWGHLETLDQAPASAPKYALMLEHFDTFNTALRHIDNPLGSVPQFTTNAILSPGIAGQSYTADITTSGGDGTRTITVIGSFLDPGLSVGAGPTAGTLRVTGTPTVSRKNFIMARLNDGDGDPAWRVFTLETFGGLGTLVQSDFRGTSPGLNLPWTPTFVLSPKVTWSGWSAGAGINPAAGDNALVFGVNGTSADNETLAQAITDNEFLTATVTPAQGAIDLRGGEIRFSTRRIGFHAPLGYALFCSITGFAQANALYVSSSVSKDNFDEVEHVITIPSTAAFSAVNAPFSLRIVAFGAQFDNHATSLTGFKLTQSASLALTAPTNLVATGTSSTQIGITWSTVAGATYELFRDGASIATPVSASFTDTVSSGTAHVYKVRATASGVSSGFSNSDLATAIVFSTDTIVRATHVTQLRTAINAVRAAASLSAATFTDPTITTGTTKVKAAHITELRTALSAAMTALSLTPPSFAAGASAGSPVKAVHVQELRAAVQ